MEFVSCGFEGRALVFGDDTDLTRSRNMLPDEKFCEAKQSNSKGNLFSKRAPVPSCQVYGCNKDLSSSKDYHKRHKVCDDHSKTAVVVVNGVRQRFCQQCSRFHIVAEFDEGKRSCRKRLAGHNQRRRKPQFSTHLAADASHSHPLLLPTAFFTLQCNDPQSVLPFHGIGKHYPSHAPSSSHSASALSLLSPPKQNLSTMPMPHSLISQGIQHANLFTPQNSGESSFQNNGLPVVQNARDSTNTVNLLQLSLHLQRVEQHKYYGRIKMENNNFCDSTIASRSKKINSCNYRCCHF